MPNPPPAPGPALSGAPAEAAETVNVRIPWPHSVFHSGVDGVDPIGTEFTAIPASSLPEVQAAAAHSHIELIEETP